MATVFCSGAVTVVCGTGLELQIITTNFWFETVETIFEGDFEANMSALDP